MRICRTEGIDTEIILKAIDGGARFEFPSLPSEITVGNGANYRSYKIIGMGDVQIPKGTDSEKISWESIFYGPSKQGEAMMRNYMDPLRCVNILEGFRDSGTPLTVMCTDVGINRDMTISDFQWTPYGGHGNIRYSISFTQWKSQQVKVNRNADTNNAPNSAADTPEERPEPPPARNYTIKSGDTLYAIAQRNLGGGSNWQKIYEANKDTIEAAAKKHGKKSSDNGHWIYPGVTLTMPS